MRFKFTLVLLLALGITVVGGGVLFGYLLQADRLEEVDHILSTSLLALRQSDLDENRPEDIREKKELVDVFRDEDILWVWQMRGGHRFSSTSPRTNEVLDLCQQEGYSSHRLNNIFYRCLKKSQLAPAEFGLVAVALVPGSEPFFYTKKVWFYLMVLMGLGVGVALWLSFWLFKPINDLAGRIIYLMNHVSSEDFSSIRDRLKAASKHRKFFKPDEFDYLLEQFGNLLSEFSEVLRQAETQAARLGHEMITPLAVLRARIHDLQGRSTGLHPRELEPLKVQLDHLSQLASGYQRMAEVSVRMMDRSQLHALDVKVSLSNICDRLRPLHQGRLKLRDSDENLKLLVNPHDFEIYLQNLITNSLKYSPSSSFVEVELSRREIIIYDSGRGLPLEVVKRLGEPYNRWFSPVGGDSAINANVEGSGMGLFICKSIARKYNWGLQFEAGEQGHKIITSITDEGLA